MASIIQGYEYDIFISYRQKDNKGDRWVSEFVNALKTELESTFKEDISLYFDINPHDGLSETNDVDASLRDKLKCLVFIPVISRTYCDPKSFAWEHEFMIFAEMASHDQFGLKIKLVNGNVSNRILPVQIHDIDKEDAILFERESGGILRPIEFIFKFQGVNRPLVPSDNPDKNQNQTLYRDQINKVSNAIHEIIRGIRASEVSGTGASGNSTILTTPGIPARKKLSLKNVLYAGLACILVTLVTWKVMTVSPGTKSSMAHSAGSEISIAVLPFENLSNDPQNEYFSKGVVQAIERNLSQIGELRVISMGYTDISENQKKSSYEISKEFSVAYLLEGSIQRSESTVRLEVKLIDAKKENQLWADVYDRKLHDIFRIQSEIAEQVASALRARISPKEKNALNKSMTDNANAYDLYLKGMYESSTFTRKGIYKALEYFKLAVGIDSTFALGYIGIAQSSIGKASIFGAELNTMEAFNEALPYLKKAAELDPDLPEVHFWTGFYLLYNNWDFSGAEKEYKKAIINNNNIALHAYCDLLNFVKRDSEALVIARRLNETDPYYPNPKMVQGLYYMSKFGEAAEFAKSRLKLYRSYSSLEDYGFLMLNTNKSKEAIGSFQQLIELEGLRYPRPLGWMGAAYARSGRRDSALLILEELKASNPSTHAGSVDFFMAVIYAALGDKKSAIGSLQEAYKYHEMEMPWLISEPQFYSLKNEPEFQALVKKVGFP